MKSHSRVKSLRATISDHSTTMLIKDYRRDPLSQHCLLPTGETAQTGSEKAEVLNAFFSSVCTVEDGKCPAFQQVAANDDRINHIEFDAAKLIAASRRTKNKSKTSSGPDGYPMLLLQNTIGAVAQPLAQMYNSFQSTGKIPSKWKTATVASILKKGPSSDPGNYRPISQTRLFFAN